MKNEMQAHIPLPPGSLALGGPVVSFMADQAISKYKYVRTTYFLPPAVSENRDISRYNDYDIHPHPAVSIIKISMSDYRDMSDIRQIS